MRMNSLRILHFSAFGGNASHAGRYKQLSQFGGKVIKELIA